MKRHPMKTAVTQTVEDYASRSSIHGIGYVFDRELFSEHMSFFCNVLSKETY